MATGLKVDETMYREITRLRREAHLGAGKIGQQLGLAKATVQRAFARMDAEGATNGQGPDPIPAAPALDDVTLRWIQLEGETQGRERLNPAVIRDYAEAMEEGAVFPPVVLFFDGDQSFWIGDGHHRCWAAQQVGFTTIKAEVRQGGPREALLYACAANSSHGLRRTTADKHKAVTTLLEDAEWGGWSNREIARHCGVSEHLVRSLRPSRSDDGQRTYLTKHGTEATMNTSRIGARAATTAPANGEPAHGPDAGSDRLLTADEQDRCWRAAYPEFVHPAIPLDDFRLIAEGLDARSPEERQALRQRWAKRDQNALAELLGEPPFPEPEPERVEGQLGAQRWEKYFYEMTGLTISITQHWSALMRYWPVQVKRAALAETRRWHATLGQWVTALEEELTEAEHGDVGGELTRTEARTP
jgi:ParB-like nuclease domain